MACMRLTGHGPCTGAAGEAGMNRTNRGCWVGRIALGALPQIRGGRYWDRTSGFHRVKVALYR
jgi:hypothetical protein